MIGLPIVIDDCIDKSESDFIENLVFDCSWNFLIDNVHGKIMPMEEQRTFLNPFEYNISPCIVSNLMDSKNKKIFKEFYPFIKKSTEKINFNLSEISRCYCAINFLVRKRQKSDYIHVNQKDPHLVMLYYVNDSDGDTIFYNKTFNDLEKIIVYPEEDSGELKESFRVSPKKGRIVFFDGSIYHAPSTPSKGFRCIITLDLFGKFQNSKCEFATNKYYKKINYV